MKKAGHYSVPPFSPYSRICQVPLKEIREGLKPMLYSWGLPGAMKFDNGQPFADTAGNMIPPLALWLLGNGIEPIYNRPNSPRDNAKVE